MMELVALSKGAEAQKLALRHLNAIQYMGLDIIVFLTCLSLAFRSYLRRRRRRKLESNSDNLGSKMKTD